MYRLLPRRDLGVEIKKYPCCGSAHLALDATAALLSAQPFQAGDVEKIDVKVDFDPPRSLIHSRPQSGLEGKFSMQYCLSAMLLDGQIGLGTFTDEQVQRGEAQSLIPQIEMRRIPGHEGEPSWTEAYNELDFHLKDGRVLTQRAARHTTGALRGVTYDDIRVKFRDCAAQVMSNDYAIEAVQMLDRLEDLDDLPRLVNLLRGD